MKKQQIGAVKVKEAKTITRGGRKIAVRAVAAKVKVAAIVSNQWKAAKKAGLDRLMGHGGIYNLRKGDVTGNLLSEGKATGALSRKVCITSGARGLCFVDGNANAARQFVFSNYTLDFGKVKKVVYFGDLAGAVSFVRKNGKAEAGRTASKESFTHYLTQGGAHYALATDGKRLLRLEAVNCSGTAGEHLWNIGK